MTFEALLRIAGETLNPWALTEDSSAGGVVAAIETDKGNVYTGVCIDVPCSMGFCAEHAAIAAMITARENRIVRMVAVRATENGPEPVPPCGRCREFVYQICHENINCEVLLKHRVATLRELLPELWDD